MVEKHVSWPTNCILDKRATTLLCLNSFKKLLYDFTNLKTNSLVCVCVCVIKVCFLRQLIMWL